LAACAEEEDSALYGIVSGRDVPGDARAGARAGAREARVGFQIGTPPVDMRPVVAAHADRGIRLLLLAEFPDGRLPDAEEARSVAAWAREFGPGGRFWSGRDDDELAVRAIEFGNETSYPHNGLADRGGEYAERARDAAAALRSAGGDPPVGLLVQADEGGGGGGWVEAMFAAVPDLGKRVAGWTIHPYGPFYGERIRRLITETERAGAPSSVPVFVTEWGVASADGACLNPDNYGWDPCMGFDKAAETLRRVASDIEDRLGERFGGFYIYNAHDLAPPGASTEREHYFGAIDFGGGRKGAYTDAARALLERADGGW
jgi:hypothetical protein